jgi:hypothetical protein
MEAFFDDHRTIFAIIIALLETLTLPLFVAALVHVLRGNREGFVILMTSLVILMYLMYYGFIYSFVWRGRDEIAHGNKMYCLSIMMYVLIHWAIAYTYFECASTFTPKGSPPPSRKKIIGLRILLATGCIFILFTFTNMVFSFTSNDYTYYLNALSCLMTGATMIVALCKIKHIIGS